MANDPTNPSSYTAGTITLADGINNLFNLIGTQLDSHGVGCATELTIQTDASGAIYVGSPSNTAGALSATNYGYTLAAGGQSRTYRSSGVERTPIPSIFIFCVGVVTIHVEVIA